MAGASNADVMDLMYGDVGAQLKEMVAEHQLEKDVNAERNLCRKLCRARRADAAKRAKQAEDERDRTLLCAPLPSVNGESGPGSNGSAAVKTLENKEDRKRKAREAMTPEQRQEDDERKAERSRKVREGRALSQARKERKEREANEPPEKVLRPIQEIEDDLDTAERELHSATVEARHNNRDNLAVTLEKLGQDVVELQEELRLTTEEREARARQAGAECADVSNGCVPIHGGRWLPKGVWFPADLKCADEKELREANAQCKQQVDRLNESGQADTELHRCAFKTWKELGAELRRRLENSKAFQVAAKNKAKEEKITAKRQRAIDNFDEWQDHLTSKADIAWWYELGQQEAYFKHFGKSMPSGEAEGQTKYVPAQLTPILQAEVETEEL